ncbi:hypothetical protein GFL95_10840 [Rhizobium leguminosarum bv. viciae]|uniref:thiamine pyrophosphate-binding protein n=1 Tax=Rhizobium leguminosarum TaxID=384 RepID=UPI0014418696|nr:thiamine pyrophosphate-binding protein [Rhizobium leguminosarum]NKK91727.1 hypothetical protein [Rhizobium leguminosarum bv. viciae]
MAAQRRKRKVKGSDLLARGLEEQGFKCIGIPGEESLDIMESIRKSKTKIKFVTTPTEWGAALIAAIYGRLTGRPAVWLAAFGSWLALLNGRDQNMNFPSSPR